MPLRYGKYQRNHLENTFRLYSLHDIFSLYLKLSVLFTEDTLCTGRSSRSTAQYCIPPLTSSSSFSFVGLLSERI
jgi:hypothetical protein